MSTSLAPLASAEPASPVIVDSPRITPPGATAKAAESDSKAAFDEKEVRSALSRTGEQIVVGGHEMRFNYDRDLHRVVVTVRSKATGEVVRTIPPAEYIKFAARMRELMGVLLEKDV